VGRYVLQIIEPAGFTGKRFDLPPVVPAGTTVHTFKDVYHHSDVISAKISFAAAPPAAQSPAAVSSPFTCSPMQDLSRSDPLVYSKYGYTVEPVTEQFLVRLFKKDRLVVQQVVQIPEHSSAGGMVSITAHADRPCFRLHCRVLLLNSVPASRMWISSSTRLQLALLVHCG